MTQEVTQFVKAALSVLKVGVTLRSPIIDVRSDRKILLLSAGTMITEPLLERLRERGITHVRIEQADLNQMSGHGSPQEAAQAAPRSAIELRDAYGEQQRAGQVPDVSSSSYLHKLKDREAVKYEPANVERFARGYSESLGNVERLFECLEKDKPADGKVAASMSEQALSEIADDMDLFLALGLKPEADKYPPRHGLQTAMLAMSMGVCLRMNEQQLVDMGIGCVLHDAGMLQINQKIYQSRRPLTKAERLEITKHPQLAFSRVRSLRAVSGSALGVVLQMHERCDRSGYPRALDGRRIHLAAKIAGIADVFLALISPRPHRPGLLPYFAISQILQEVRRGVFDGLAARSLLHTTSLFPIGSYVEVSDNRVGRVIRSNGTAYARPVLELWPPRGLQEPSEVVDLAATPHLCVTKPLASLKPAA